MNRLAINAATAAIFLIHFTTAKSDITFDVHLSAAVAKSATSGRLYVVIAKSTKPEPISTVGNTGLDIPATIAVDVRNLAPGKSVHVSSKAGYQFPPHSLDHLAGGQFYVQALLHTNQDLNFPGAPGDLYSSPTNVKIGGKGGSPISLTLSQTKPLDFLPKETEYVKFVKIKSELLSAFWHRPIYLRGGIIIPKGYATQTESGYPLWVRIGGFASRYDGVLSMMSERSGFRKTWLAEDSPRMVMLLLDGAGPLGDPYQVNSANNGPYGDAITRELIPAVEKRFRCIGNGKSRFLDGGSTGGWVSLALQVYYPDFFNGTWSVSPDPIDFRAYQLVNIYKDKQAFVNKYGFERPSSRDINGEINYTMRHDFQHENLLGEGNHYAYGGNQWGSWNAVFSPRLPNGKQAVLIHPESGVVDTKLAETWNKNDLRLYLEANWAKLAPKLAGKVHISVGDADGFYLNNAVRLFDVAVHKFSPPFDGEIRYAPEKGHTWSPWSDFDMMREMVKRPSQ